MIMSDVPLVNGVENAMMGKIADVERPMEQRLREIDETIIIE